MSEKKTLSADMLVAVQFLAMCAFGGAQFRQMLASVQGVSPVWLLCAEAFCLFSVALAFDGWRQFPGRATKQLLAVHGGWTAVFTVLLVLLLLCISEVDWSWYDNAMLGGVVVLASCVLSVARFTDLGVKDPIVRGLLAAIFRGIPHMAMTYKIYHLGGGGLACVTIWAAHVSACTRILLLCAAVYAAGWDRTRRGMAIGEGVNEATWIMVTIVWYVNS